MDDEKPVEKKEKKSKNKKKHKKSDREKEGGDSNYATKKKSDKKKKKKKFDLLDIFKSRPDKEKEDKSDMEDNDKRMREKRRREKKEREKEKEKEKEKEEQAATTMGAVTCGQTVGMSNRELTRREEEGSDGGPSKADGGPSKGSDAKTPTKKSAENVKKDPKEEEFNENLKKFLEMISALDKKDSISKFYNTTLLRIPQTTKNFTSFFANRLKNRSSDIFCAEETRIKLKAEAGKPDYIHANTIKFENVKRSYVATQHPMLNTIEDFWSMVFNESIEVVISLTNSSMATVTDFPLFFPTEKDTNATYGNYCVTCKTVKPATHRYTPVEYQLEVLPNGCSNAVLVKMLQYQHWGKYLVPASPKVVLTLLNRIKTSPSPVLVQCETGVNQASIVIFVDAIFGLIQSKQTFTLEGIFEKLRQQRCTMLSTRLQFIYSIYVILIVAKTKCNAGSLSKDLLTIIEPMETALAAEFAKSTSIEPHDASMTSQELTAMI